MKMMKMKSLVWAFVALLVGGSLFAGVVRTREIAAGACPEARLVSGGTLTLPAFDGAEIVLHLGARRTSVSGFASFTAAVEGQTGLQSAVVVATAQGFVARVQDLATGATYSFVRDAAGLTVRETVPDMPATGACGVRSLAKEPQRAAKLAAVVTSKTPYETYKKKWLAHGETYTNRVDILVTFDKTGAAWATANYGDDGVAVFAEACIAKMNLVLANSGLADYSFNLAGTYVADFDARTIKTSAGDIDFDKILDYLTGGSGAVWKKVREQREEVSADIVTLLVDNGEEASGTAMAGLGYQLDAWGLAGADDFADYTYNVCSIRHVDEGHTLTHEVGHNMGAGHGDKTQMNEKFWAVGPQLFEYSSAHYFAVTDAWGDTTRYFTVLGYNWDGFGTSSICIEAPYFSSPEATYAWVEAAEDGSVVTNDTGVAVGTEVHDNARTLRETFAIAANYRAHNVRLAVDIPSGGGAVTGGGSYRSGAVVALQAKASAGYVFAGWYRGYDEATATYLEPLDGSLDYRTPGVGYVVPLEDLTLYARFVRATDDKSSLAIACEPAAAGYDAGAAMEDLKINVASGSVPTITVKNLPAGLKFNAKTGVISGTPTKPGVYAVAVTAKNVSGATSAATVTITVGNFKDDLVTASEEVPDGLADSYGPLTPGVAVEIAVPPLAGWTGSGLPAGLKFDAKTGTISGIPTKPGTVTALFKASLMDEVLNKKVAHQATATFIVADYPVMPVSLVWVKPNGRGEDQPVEPGTTLTLVAGVRQTFTLAAEGLDGTPTTFTAKNLPAGLKLVKTPVKGEKNAVVGYTFTLEGAPTAASKMKNGAVVPSAVQLTAANKYKWSGAFAFNLVVEALPAWAQGTFEGYAADVSADGKTPQGPGVASLTAAVGKLSGKFAVRGTNWTVTATGYTVYRPASDDAPACFLADAVAKSGKITRNVTFKILPGFTTDAGDFSLCGSAAGEAEGWVIELRRNAWKDKILTPAFPSAPQALPGYSAVTAKTAASGKVTFAGKLDDGTKVSASATAVYDSDGRFKAWLVVPASKTFAGWVDWVELPGTVPAL